jgi:hypothetical protein
MADRFVGISTYQLRCALALQRTRCRISWEMDDALRFRRNFIDRANYSASHRYHRLAPFTLGSSLTISRSTYADIPNDDDRVYWFLHDQGLNRYYVKPTSCNGWGSGWQWAWRTSGLWTLFLPTATVDFVTWRNSLEPDHIMI